MARVVAPRRSGGSPKRSQPPPPGAERSRGRVSATEGETALFIHPPYAIRAVDHLLTNFHLPRSTLLALVMAFVGIEEAREIYRVAVG